MSKIIVGSPTIEQETESRLVLATGSQARRQRAVFIAMLAVASVAGMAMGLVGDEVAMILGTTLLCVTPALVLLFVVPYAYGVALEADFQTVTVTEKRLLGLGPWPRWRERSIRFAEIRGGGYSVNPLGTIHKVELTASDDRRITLQFGPDEKTARRVANKVADLVGSAVDPGVAFEAAVEPEVVPFTGWRFALAAVFGLAAALAWGYIWRLVTTATNTKYGLVAIFVGFTVGAVVSLMGGGNRDARYSILGVVLSGIGIAYGEFLIYGLPSSEYVYQFQFTDLLIYGIALYEGWIIPRRSMPLARKGGQWISEGNWKVLMAAGSAILILILGASALTGGLPSEETEAKIHFDRGVVLIDEGEYEEAIAELKEAIRLKPDYAQAHSMLGLVYHEMGRLEEAEVAANAAVSADPSLGEAHFALGLISLGRGDWDASIDSFNRALDLAEDKSDESLVLTNRGLVHAIKGDLDQALKDLDQAAGLDKNNAVAFFLRGLVHAELGEQSSAIADLENALDLGLEPDMAQDAQLALDDLQR